ncbi:MAG: agmatine deiminase family protein [Bacteroidales bacterium]|nr:agmatine deiminase family protein [Bacteroidales bacterium]
MTPKELGYFMPAEWAKHEATWLTYPKNPDSWPGKIETIYPSYHLFVKTLAECEMVHINVDDDTMLQHVKKELEAIGTNMQNITLHLIPSNDAWCRDHGPAFLVRSARECEGVQGSARECAPRAIVNWNHNAWGGKYPYDLDTQVPLRIYEYLKNSATQSLSHSVTLFEPKIVMEGGSIDVNGCGDLLTTASCLLNPNRNPQLDQDQIEGYLRDYYGVDNILWLCDGIVGDDTDGHVDDLARFVAPDTIVTVVEEDAWDENYEPLQKNLRILNRCRLANGKQPTIVELPMPDIVFYDNQRLPASYANFYIANGKVIFPTYRCLADNQAAYILEALFPDREIIGIDSTDIIWGLGSFHCLSQQMPAIQIEN